MVWSWLPDFSVRPASKSGNCKGISAYQVEYVDLEIRCRQGDIITLHVPLLKETRHIINAKTIGLMHPGVMLISTRGALGQYKRCDRCA
ncbi:MAG: hypothetical protein C0523_06660 [Cytophaga sp.]|nr:hypothetical protein [Cytophaga sp.]